MRRFFLIFPVIICFSLQIFAQAEVSIDCQDQWGAGHFNKVSVQIEFNVAGFARFTQDFPVGFDIAGTESPGCDFSWTGSQINVVCMNISQGKRTELTYYVKPDASMNGEINLGGEVVVISEGVTKYSVKLNEKAVEIGGSNGLLPGEMKDKSIQKVIVPEAKAKIPEIVTYSSNAVFKVQVSASSKVIPESRLRKDLGIGKDVKISIVKSGNVYKYHAGGYSEYDSAARLLKTLKGKGVNGAFIVAYLRGEQVDVEKARKSR